MGLQEKASNTAQEAGGKMKQAAGDLTDNDRLKAEGKGEEKGAQVKQVGENVKDVLR